MRYRLTQPKDLLIAQSLLPSAYRYSSTTFDALASIWKEWLISRQLIGAVIEQSEPNLPDQVLGIGLSVFVTDAFVDNLLSAPVPYLNARLHDMILAGESPVLTANQIAKDNLGDGLNLIPLHFLTPDEMIHDSAKKLSASQDLFRIMHGGFKVKRIIKEVVNSFHCQLMQNTGLKLMCDYALSHPEYGLEKLPVEERPYLLTLSYEEMPIGGPMWVMFTTTPVRFFFSPAEQRLLLCAILRDSDKGIASDLCLSEDTIRKHWKSIFQRVLDVDASFFLEESQPKVIEGTRGRGKRRYLLRYLQQHMAELRPHSNAKV